jgi:hypothetical protein
MAVLVFTIISLLGCANAARIRQITSSGSCAPVMAKWVCQASVVDENRDCVEELCNSDKMANYKDNGPHPFRDACCKAAGLAIPGSVDEQAEDLSESADLKEPVVEAEVPVFQEVEIQPRKGKVLDKVFYAPERAKGLSWAMTCVSLCEKNTAVDDSHESSCQAIQTEDDCESAKDQIQSFGISSDLIKPTTEKGRKMFAKYPAGCLVPQGKNFALWNPPEFGKGIVVNNICASYKLQ